MKRKVFTFLLVFLVTVGCVTDIPAQTSTISVNTLTSTIKHTLTPTPTLPPDDNCIEVKTGNLDELKSAGTIVLEDDYYKAYTINANTFEKAEIAKEDEHIYSIVTSPNRQLTAYSSHG